MRDLENGIDIKRKGGDISDQTGFGNCAYVELFVVCIQFVLLYSGTAYCEEIT